MRRNRGVEIEPDILIERQGPIGWLTFSNPARRNAVTLGMWARLDAGLDEFAKDPTIRVVVLRGAGGKSFVSGADISQFDKERDSAEMADRYAAVSEGARRKLREFPKPVIAMIEGFCIGGGMVVAASADIRIAGESAVFGIPAGRLGLGYGADSVKTLLGIVTPAVLREMLLTAGRFDAQQALRMGLIARAVPDDMLLDAVRDMATAIAENAPLTLAAAKLAIADAIDPQDPEAVEAAIRACFDSEDYREGRQAFREKRKPRFHGR